MLDEEIKRSIFDIIKFYSSLRLENGHRNNDSAHAHAFSDRVIYFISHIYS